MPAAAASPYDKDFTRARLQAMDDLRRNGQLTAAARLVGLEIFACVNRVSGCAFPAEETIAKRLGISGRTVRTAIAQLRAAGCLKVMRRGRSNLYFPTFRIEEKISGIASAGLADDEHHRKKTAPIPEKNSADTGKKQPPNSVSNPIIRTFLRETTGSLASAEALRSPVRNRQKAENEIAKIIGWDCLQAAPQAETEDLCNRWPNVDAEELLEFKRKYEGAAC
jgi:hypothetical protein